MDEPIELVVELTSGQKKALRGMGHHLEPVVYVGKEGLSPTLLKSTQAALQAHELIKIKLGQNCPIERNRAGRGINKEHRSCLGADHRQDDSSLSAQSGFA